MAHSRRSWFLFIKVVWCGWLFQGIDCSSSHTTEYIDHVDDSYDARFNDGAAAHSEYGGVTDEKMSGPIYSVTYTDRDPALHLMTYRLDDDLDKVATASTESRTSTIKDRIYSTWVYREPNVTTFYPSHYPLPAQSKVMMKFEGYAAKFINLSNERLALYWCVWRSSMGWMFCRFAFRCFLKDSFFLGVLLITFLCVPFSHHTT